VEKNRREVIGRGMKLAGRGVAKVHSQEEVRGKEGHRLRLSKGGPKANRGNVKDGIMNRKGLSSTVIVH